MLDAIDVIVQYTRDQAVVSARDQALAWVSPRALWITENTYMYMYLSGVFEER